MKPLRRFVWIPAALLLAIIVALAVWPRKDDYEFLRDLHPKEVDRVLLSRDPESGEAVDHHFEFGTPLGALKSLLQERGALIGWRQGDIMDANRVHLPNGKMGRLVTIGADRSELRVDEPDPSWLKLRLADLRRLLHVD